ncbi:MAG: RsmD family RNA methyltransferase [Victivallales bacterium]|nr:RsmD family RNA methyltransferase [Victivallales bacterium]
MNIISGKAKSIQLSVPQGLAVRPTSVRARKALFDSLGDFSGAKVVDLFAGCGSLGLEAASRGAAAVLLVENSRGHCRAIEENIEKVKKAGVDSELQVVAADVLGGVYRAYMPEPDIIFADPPYPESAANFEKLMNDAGFVQWAKDAYLVWEVPSFPGTVGKFLNQPCLTSQIRSFGGTSFLVAIVK